MNFELTTVPVFLLPFAGANRNSYRILQTALDRLGVASIPLELPGHGSRVSERLLGTIGEMEDDLAPQIIPKVEGSYVLFGHSMGALLAYRIALRSVAQGAAPLCMIVSGRGAPTVPLRRVPIHTLQGEAFIREMRRLGGSPEEVLRDSELMEFFEPILRSDFRAVETYRHRQASPLAVPITVIRGAEDTVTAEDAERWNEMSQNEIQTTTVPGGHFHILERPDETAQIIRQSILNAL